MNQPTQKILVTGATGYVGGRLVPKLLEAGYQVRALGRSLKKLQSRPWASHPALELCQGDCLDLASLKKAISGCDAAYYLVHSMNPQQADFHQADQQAAQNMVRAAEEGGLRRIIYLGGLGDENAQLSRHLRSRSEVGKILQSGKVPTTIFRAAMIIGSGSASFEILRYLVERLPLMVTPRWVETLCQPIAIRNVLEYLVRALEVPQSVGQVYDIGGPQILSYRHLMEIYAEEANLPKRWVIPVPVLTPRLSSYWIHLVTPVSAAIAKPLAEGLINPAITQENRIREWIPQKLLSCREAIRLALDQIGEEKIISHWSDAGAIAPLEWSQEGDPEWAGGTLFVDLRRKKINASQENVWKFIESIGGSRGWYHATWLWSLRGFLDKLVGGVGLRRGRRNPRELRPGDALDFWRVVWVERPKHLLLVAEMKLPGKASLEFKIKRLQEDQCEVEQCARFRPRGLWGIFYWYFVFPFHGYIFKGMLEAISQHAENASSVTDGEAHENLHS